jgi:hypothetical protein
MPNYVLGLEPVFCFNNFSINWILYKSMYLLFTIQFISFIVL